MKLTNRRLANMGWSMRGWQANRAATSFKHDPPQVIWTTDAVWALVLIHGDPVLRPVTNNAVLHVINTVALILFSPSGGTDDLADQGDWIRGFLAPWRGCRN